MESKEESRKRLLELNKKQAEFYDDNIYTHREKENLLVRLWGDTRDKFHHFRTDIGIMQTSDDLHELWLGDLSDKKVLDLGVGGGNALSVSIASRCKEYHAIDLSEKLAKQFQEVLNKKGLQSAHSYKADFLSDEFDQKDFDIIYALGVAHHFEDFDLFLETAQNKLKKGGKMITYDPLNTFFISKLIRAMFRPFQNDAAWEWPFEKSNFAHIQKRFEIEGVQGTYGRSKWAFPLLFINKKWAVKRGIKAHQKDLQESNKVGAPLFRCLQVTMSMVKK